MNYIGTGMDGTNVYMGEDIIILCKDKKVAQIITPKDLYLIDSDGKVISTKELKNCFTPTYNELYEYWLKTKE